MFTGRLRSEIPIALVILYIITKLRPVLYVEFRSCRMQFKQYIMKLNEVYHLIIYCLNCIRRDQNSTYKTWPK
jgi:hypothetical protein